MRGNLSPRGCGGSVNKIDVCHAAKDLTTYILFTVLSYLSERDA